MAPPPPPLPDEDWLKQFSYLPTWTTEQLHLLQKALITQRHEATVWSDNDWDIGTHPELHHIDVPPGTIPVRLRPYKMAPVKSELLQLFLENLCKAGVLEQGSSPWGFPLLMAKKPGRDASLPQSYRLLCDFRRLNDLLHVPSTPLPLIDNILNDLPTYNKCFSIQDLTQGFFAIRLDESTSRMCCIVAPNGQSYLFKRLPQGLKTSPNFFSQLTVSAFTPIRHHTRPYIDDLITATDSFESMITALQQGWKILASQGLKLKPQKCLYCRPDLNILGWHIDQYGRRPQADKMKALQDMASPTNLKDLQSLLGLLNYYRDQVHRYSDKISPLLDILGAGKKVPFNWSPTAETAMRDMISELSSLFAINHLTDGELRIYTDASDKGLSGVLVEYPKGTDLSPLSTSFVDNQIVGKVIAFCSKRFTSVESRYTISDRELLAIVYSVEHFHTYLNRKFQVITDHGALEMWKTISSSTSKRLQRYSMYLSSYCMDLCYRDGLLNVVADLISRLFEVHHSTSKSEIPRFHPASTLLNLTLSTSNQETPVAAIPVVGALVAVRLEKTAWLRTTLKKSVITNSDRYGIITKVHKNKQLIVKFASGATRQTSVNRLQTIPLPDYIAALSLPDDAAATMEIGLQQQLRVAQDCDRETQELLHWKDTPLHKQRLLADIWKFDITLHDDIIITDPTNKLVYFKSDKSAQPRLVIPAELRQAYCKLAHSSVLLGAHRDVESTRLLLEPLVYWPDMLHDMKTFQKSCHTCQTHAYPRQLVNTPVGSLSAFKPLQRLSIDHIGPFPKNDSGMKYLLVVIDHFTKYVWVFATPDNNAHTTALLFWNISSASSEPPRKYIPMVPPRFLARNLANFTPSSASSPSTARPTTLKAMEWLSEPMDRSRKSSRRPLQSLPPSAGQNQLQPRDTHITRPSTGPLASTHLFSCLAETARPHLMFYSPPTTRALQSPH